MSVPVPGARQLISGASSATAPYPTVESLKAMLGIAEDDDSKDAAIAALLNSSLALIENYCLRRFALGDYEERFIPVDSRNPNLLLSAYPVESVAAVLQDVGFENDEYLVRVNGWRLFRADGILQQWAPSHCWCPCGWQYETVVDYRGGYPPDAWPAELVDVLTRLFFDRWNATGGSGLLTAGSSGGGTGEIKSATVDGMRLDYDVGGFSYKGAEDIPPELLPYAAILAPYRALDRALWGV